MSLLSFISKFYEPTLPPPFLILCSLTFLPTPVLIFLSGSLPPPKVFLSFSALMYWRLLSVLPYLKLFSPMTLHSFDLLSTTLSLSLPLLPCPSLQIHLNSLLSSIQSIRNLTHCHRFNQHLSAYNYYIYICSFSLSLKFLTCISNFLLHISTLIFYRLSNLTFSRVNSLYSLSPPKQCLLFSALWLFMTIAFLLVTEIRKHILWM